MVEDGTDLRRYLRDLVALSALPAVWVGQSTQAIVESFAEALLRTLQSEFVYVRLEAIAESQPAVEIARADSGAADPRQVRDAARALEVPISYAGRRLGVVTCGMPLDNVPSEHERLLVQVAANQLAIAVETAQLQARQVELAERERAEQELRRSEERFRALIDHSSDILTLQQRNGTITYVSPSTSRQLGYAPTELLGRSLLDVVHPEDRTWLEPRFAGLVDQPGEVMTVRYRIKHKNGTWRWIEATYTNLLHEPAVGAVVINRRDVNAEVEAQQLLEDRVVERTRELESLYQADETLYRSLRLDDVLQALVDVSADILRVDKSTVLAPGEAGDRLVVRASRGFLQGQPHGTLTPLTLPSEDGVIGDVMRTAEPFTVRDIRADRRLSPRVVEWLETERLGALLSVPIIAEDGVFAVFTIYYTAPHHFTDEERRILQALAHRAGLAIENARLYEAARGIAALEERQRLARELHDSVSQALYAIGLMSAAARQERAADSARRDRLLGDVLGLAEGGLAEMRALIFELRPESLEEEGLVGALNKQAAAIQARHKLVVNTRLSAEPVAPLSTKEVLYRVAQEALHNVAKHARASVVELALETHSGKLVLQVGDDGKGFDPAGSFPGHLGLRSMRERVAAVGGTLEIHSAPGKGTQICVRVPPSAQTSEVENAIESPRGPRSSRGSIKPAVTASSTRQATQSD
jgi:PAS domain S-box-containing protein